MALRMKKQWSDVCDILAGRHTHPITCCVRGFTKLPTKEELVRMRDIILSQEKDLAATLDIFKTVTLPAFERETEYVALSHPGEYAFLEGDVVSSDTKKAVGPRDYLQVVHEFHEPHSTSKHAKNVRDSYFVGALARANINFDKLDKEAKAAAAALGFSVPCHNPFMNTVAQVVEYVHCYHDALRILDRFIRDGIDYGQAVTSWPRNSELAGGAYKVKAGRGVGAVEVPRGVLFHDYTVKEDATIEKANCVIPTNQNLANIDLDMKKMIPEIIDLTKEQITLRAEMLVRAYDPCISCSCHLVKVDFAD